MAARIRSTVNEFIAGPQVGAPLSEASRDDLRRGNEVILESLDVHATYGWTLAFTPRSPDGTASVATLLAPQGSTSSTARFVVDNEGAYLIRLVVDAGLPSESVQFVRLRQLTHFGGVKLVAAGERRDETGVVPVDATPEGWARDQNQNLQRLLGLVRRTATTGRTLYVDANRGRSNTASADDPTNSFEIPGSNTSGSEDDLAITAEKHADFSTVGEAIAYALASAGRGEPAPSQTNPWLIKVQPGVYTEDLTFLPWIHVEGLCGANSGQGGVTNPVVLRTANAAGGSHEYDSAGTCHLSNLRLENTSNTATAPVLQVSDGTLILTECVLLQKGTGVAVGPALSVTDNTNAPAVIALNSTFLTDADNTETDCAVRISCDDNTVFFRNCYIEAQRVGLEINADLYEMASSNLVFDSCNFLTTDHACVRAYGNASFYRCVMMKNGPLTDVVVDLDGFGEGAASKPGDVDVHLSWCYVDGRVAVDTLQAAGTVTVHVLGTSFGGQVEASPSVFQFITGTPDILPGNYSFDVGYSSDWQGFDGTDLSSVPAAAQLTGVVHVQDALDALINLVLPLGASPFYSLTSAYNGLASHNPMVVGAGLGREVLADDGAVQITGASSPLTFAAGLDPLLDGGLQVEGRLDVGPLAGDGRGSEIAFDPNTFGFGPIIRLGREVYPSLGATLRPIVGGLLVSGPAEGTPQELNVYNMRVRVKDHFEANQSGLGHAIVQAGTRVDNASGAPVFGGSVYLKAGDQRDSLDASTGGNVVLAPGLSAGAGVDGRVSIIQASAATPAILDAANVFPGNIPVGDGGVLFLQGDDGTVIPVSIPDGTNYATVRANINTAAEGRIIASDNAGRLRLTSGTLGEIADFGVIGDYVPAGLAGDLLVALGELRVGSGATWTAGTFPNIIELECTDPGELTVHGDLVVTGSLTGSVSSAYVNTSIDYAMQPGDEIVGVDTALAAGNVTITLPAAPVAGQKVVVKDEGNNASVNNVILDTPAAELVDGAATLTININYAAATLYFNGTNWFIY